MQLHPNDESTTKKAAHEAPLSEILM